MVVPRQIDEATGDEGYLAWAERAMHHMVLGEQPQVLAACLGGGAGAGSAGPSRVFLVVPRSAGRQAERRERGAAVLRVVLQFLAVENLRDANAFWAALEASLPHGDAHEQHGPVRSCGCGVFFIICV